MATAESLPEKGWTYGPNQQGSFDILWTFLRLLCASGLQYNMRLLASWKRNLLTRLGMISVAVLLPEMLIYSEWRQGLEARKLVKAFWYPKARQISFRIETDTQDEFSTTFTNIDRLTLAASETKSTKSEASRGKRPGDGIGSKRSLL